VHCPEIHFYILSKLSINIKRVLISGAGIAGLTLACCLADHSWQADVIEKADSERKSGYMITFFYLFGGI
jgi:aspartate oxidase